MTDEELQDLFQAGPDAWDKMSLDEFDAFREELVTRLTEVAAVEEGIDPNRIMFIKQMLGDLSDARRECEAAAARAGEANAMLAEAYAAGARVGFSPDEMDAWFEKYQEDPAAALANLPGKTSS